MSGLFVEFLALALAAIAPVMIGVVILLLSLENGLVKALSFLAARVIGYALWGVLFLSLGERLSTPGQEGPSTASLVIKLTLGIVLLVLAAKTYFAEEDPDAPPPKWMSALNKAGTGALFGIGFILTLIQIRFVLLMLIGAGAIAETQLSAGMIAAAMTVLITVVLWPQLLPLLLYLLMGRRAKDMLGSMNQWLQDNSRIVNVVILVLFGIKLLWDSLSGLGVFG